MAENKKKVYLITFKCDCILGECAQIINDECGLSDLGYRIDFEQMEGNLSKDTKKYCSQVTLMTLQSQIQKPTKL